MGRDVAGLRIDKKPNAVTMKSNGISQDKVHVSPKVAGERIETKDYEVGDHTVEQSTAEESHEKQDVLGVKSTNHEAGLTDGRILKEAVRSSDKTINSPVKPASGSAADISQTNSTISKSPGLKPEKEAPKVTHSDVNCSSNNYDLPSPPTAKKSQSNSPFMSRKPQSDLKKHLDEEDNWSLASSAAASVRTNRSRITVPVAPTFRSADRATRRQEFYMKLEEKHRALEAEKMEYEARTKEEEEAALRQLRKNLVVKANPVPKFYREGPPPKIEPKKLPLTRAKSPKLNRRKSCGDAITSSVEEKGVCTRANRHSVGIYKEGNAGNSPVKKDQRNGRHGNGTPKDRDRSRSAKEGPNNSSPKMADQRTADIAVES